MSHEPVTLWCSGVGIDKTDPHITNIGRPEALLTFHSSEDGSRLTHEARRIPIYRIKNVVGCEMRIKIIIFFPSNIDQKYETFNVMIDHWTQKDLIAPLNKWRKIQRQLSRKPQPAIAASPEIYRMSILQQNVHVNAKGQEVITIE